MACSYCSSGALPLSRIHVGWAARYPGGASSAFEAVKTYRKPWRPNSFPNSFQKSRFRRTSLFGTNSVFAPSTPALSCALSMWIMSLENVASANGAVTSFIHFVDHNVMTASRCAGIYVIFTLVFHIPACNTFKLCLVGKGNCTRLTGQNFIFDFQVFLIGKPQRQSLLLSSTLANKIQEPPYFSFVSTRQSPLSLSDTLSDEGINVHLESITSNRSR